MSANIEIPGASTGPEHDPAVPSRNGESRAAQPRDKATVTLPRVKPGHPAADLIRGAFRAAVSRVQAADPEARRGDVEGIHRLRTSTRRLRSELRTVRHLIDADWREHLEEELKWLAGMLGSVRDLDILCQHLRDALPASATCVPGNGKPSNMTDGDILRPFFDTLRERHAESSRALREALRGSRYQKLLAMLELGIDRPPLEDDAWESCRTVLPPLAVEAWKRVKKGARALRASDPDPAFHEVRKLAKRARYTAELIAPALGDRARKASQRFIRLATQVQDTLGEHQDAIVGITEIEQFLSEQPRGIAFLQAAHELLETQRAAAQATRTHFFDIWSKLDRKKSLRWLRVKHGARV